MAVVTALIAAAGWVAAVLAAGRAALARLAVVAVVIAGRAALGGPAVAAAA